MFEELFERCIQESTKWDRLRDSLVKPSLDLLLSKGRNVDEEGVLYYLDKYTGEMGYGTEESDKLLRAELISLKDAFEEGDEEKAMDFLKNVLPTKKKKVKTEAREKIEDAFAKYKETSDPVELLELLKTYPKEAEKLRKETVRFLKKKGITKLYRFGSERGRKGVLSYTWDTEALKQSFEQMPLLRRKQIESRITADVEKRIIACETTADFHDIGLDEAEVLLRIK